MFDLNLNLSKYILVLQYYNIFLINDINGTKINVYTVKFKITSIHDTTFIREGYYNINITPSYAETDKYGLFNKYYNGYEEPSNKLDETYKTNFTDKPLQYKKSFPKSYNEEENIDDDTYFYTGNVYMNNFPIKELINHNKNEEDKSFKPISNYDNRSIMSGDLSDDDMFGNSSDYKKYLKYKTKYLQLKNTNI